MKEDIITSRSNTDVKKVFSLLNKKGREKNGLFWAEGTKAVDAAINSKKYDICEIIVSDSAGAEAVTISKLAENKGFRVIRFSETCFKKVSALRHPEGIGVVGKTIVNTGLPDKIEKPLVILWQLQNPGNQGTIIRSAAAFDCGTVILVEPCVDEYHPMSIRATSGTFFMIDICKTPLEDLLPWLEKNSGTTAVLSPDGKEEICSEDFLSSKILIIGNEPHGISEELKKFFKTAVISMNSKVESLNTSCAASIAMYELWGRNR